MLQLLSEHACFGGVQRFYQHDSGAIGLPMRFSVYLPPGAEGQRLPVYGRGANVRDWLYVEDHARALERVMIDG